MKKFKNHQRPRRRYRIDIVGHKKALKIWWDSPFNVENFCRFIQSLLLFELLKSPSIIEF